MGTRHSSKHVDVLCAASHNGERCRSARTWPRPFSLRQERHIQGAFLLRHSLGPCSLNSDHENTIGLSRMILMFSIHKGANPASLARQDTFSLWALAYRPRSNKTSKNHGIVPNEKAISNIHRITLKYYFSLLNGIVESLKRRNGCHGMINFRKLIFALYQDLLGLSYHDKLP